MRRPIRVAQRESAGGDFWYTVLGGNSENVLTSKMYKARWRAVRAARAFIASVSPAPAVFTYWSGPTLQAIQAGNSRGKVQHHTERVR